MSVSWEGDVHPTSATGFPLLGGADADADGVNDFLIAGGNQVITDGINQTDPTGVSGIGLAWDEVQIWRAYDSPYPVLSGDTTQGLLSLFASHKLRPTHVGLGWEAGSFGDLTLSGYGTEINSDRDKLSPSYKTAIGLAKSIDPSTVVYNHLWQSLANNPFDHYIPQPPGNYNAWVGRKGYARALVESGASWTVDHRLFVGCYETAEDGGTAPYGFEADPYNPVAKLLAITSAGDLATLTHGEGGLLRIREATVSVSGLTAQDAAPFPPQKTDGSTAENDAQNQYLNDTPITAGAALASVIGLRGVIVLQGGTLRVASGLVNRGLIDVEDGNYPSLIAIPDLPLDPVPATKFTNHGAVRVRSGATLQIEGDLENNGLVYLESGAVLNVTGTVSGSGEIRRSPCCPTSLLLDGGTPRYRSECAERVA